MSMTVINAFCRLRDLIFVEEQTRNGQLGYSFQDFKGHRMIYTVPQIQAMLGG